MIEEEKEPTVSLVEEKVDWQMVKLRAIAEFKGSLFLGLIVIAATVCTLDARLSLLISMRAPAQSAPCRARDSTVHLAQRLVCAHGESPFRGRPAPVVVVLRRSTLGFR